MASDHPVAALRLLAREVELNAHFGRMIADDLEESRADALDLDEQLALVVALVSITQKTSRLLWRYGNRVTDAVGAETAAALRRELGIGDDSAFAPDAAVRFAPLIRLPTIALAEAWEPGVCRVTTDGVEFDLGALGRELRALHDAARRFDERAAAPLRGAARGRPRGRQMPRADASHDRRRG